jgi:hypothetical protein
MAPADKLPQRRPGWQQGYPVEPYRHRVEWAFPPHSAPPS